MALLETSIIVALVGAGLNGGLFFIFSNTVMSALGRLPTRNGAGAMQAINEVILNPLFFVVFLGAQNH